MHSREMLYGVRETINYRYCPVSNGFKFTYIASVTYPVVLPRCLRAPVSYSKM
jgi:hypothetical protein